MTNYQSIEKQLVALIGDKTKLDPADINPQLNLESSGLDSFARIELVLAVEEQFGVEFSDREAADISTIDDLINGLLNKMSS